MRIIKTNNDFSDLYKRNKLIIEISRQKQEVM